MASALHGTVFAQTVLNQSNVGSNGSVNITKSGSYILKSNIAVTSDGLYITANNVTVDLNGFTIKEPGGGDVPCAGPGASQITIRNGNFVNFDGACGLGAFSVVEDVTFRTGGGQHTYISVGSNSRISNAIADYLICDNAALVTQTIVRATAINLAPPSYYSSCVSAGDNLCNGTKC